MSSLPRLSNRLSAFVFAASFALGAGAVPARADGPAAPRPPVAPITAPPQNFIQVPHCLVTMEVTAPVLGGDGQTRLVTLLVPINELASRAGVVRVTAPGLVDLPKPILVRVIPTALDRNLEVKTTDIEANKGRVYNVRVGRAERPIATGKAETSLPGVYTGEGQIAGAAWISGRVETKDVIHISHDLRFPVLVYTFQNGASVTALVSQTTDVLGANGGVTYSLGTGGAASIALPGSVGLARSVHLDLGAAPAVTNAGGHTGPGAMMSARLGFEWQ